MERSLVALRALGCGVLEFAGLTSIRFWLYCGHRHLPSALWARLGSSARR